MESKLVALLTPLFPSLDGPLVEYLAGVACEGGAAKKWMSGNDAFNVIGELLESYEAVANEKEAKTKCDELFKKMQETGLIATKAPPPSASSTTSALKHPAPITTVNAASSSSTSLLTPSSSPTIPVTASPTPASAKPTVTTPTPAPPASSIPQPGYTCQARYSGDGLHYKAMVLSVKTVPVVRIRVKFLDYNDEEEVPLTSLKDIVPGELPKPKPVGKRAAREAGEEDEDGEDDSDYDSDEDDDENGGSSSSSKKPGMLLSNPVRIGEVEKSLAAKRLEDRAVAQTEAERNLTPKELKLLRKRQAKAERAAKELEIKRTWNPDEHRTALTKEALPIFLQSQHLSKKAGTKDIALDDVCLLAPDNTELLVNTELRLNYGRKYGLVGRNGIGKSTLLRQISTYALPKFPTWIKIMHVEQEVIAETSTVLEVVMNADLERGLLIKEEAELNAKLKELEVEAATNKVNQLNVTEPPSPTSSTISAASSVTSTATTATSSTAASSLSSSSATETAASISDRLTVIYDRLVELESHTAQARASTILSGLQFSQEMQNMPTKALSGGWRMRVALACALFVSPDLLLLDEPTNHLDFPAVLWLQSYLQAYPKTVLIVSHDRVFLNASITDTIHFTNKKRLEYYRGDYLQFLKVREEKYKNEKRAYEAQQMHRQHLQEFITTFKTEKKSAAQDRKVGQAMSKQKVLDKMELLENPDEESSDRFSLKFPEPGQLRVPLIAEIKHLNFKYPKRVLTQEEDKKAEEEKRLKRLQGTLSVNSVVPSATALNVDPAAPYLLQDINVRVEITSRIGIIGANGCGKSTLIKILLGELQAVEGLVWLNSNVRIAYFTQHHVDQLNLGLTAVQWLQELFPKTTAVECRRHLGKFGLIGDLTLMQMGNLSGGQKSRVALSIISWQEPHMLIMDEPTNHLDMDTIDCLIKAVNEFKGAVMIISHDQHFLSGCMKQFWSIHDHKLQIFDSLEACKKATYKHIEQ